MTKTLTNEKGFTLVEIFIVCVVIAILAIIAAVTYNSVQQRTVRAVVFKDLKSAAEETELTHMRPGNNLTSIQSLPDDFTQSNDIVMKLIPRFAGDRYGSLSTVQNGVLFHAVCTELIANPLYATIHARDSSEEQSVMMSCDKNILAGNILITGWQSMSWPTPVTKDDIQDYIDSVPYDSWWTDRQTVIRAFYSELIRRFEVKGGTFPITSFWDPSANPWYGVPKEELPSPLPPPESERGMYCIEAFHKDFPDDTYSITQNNKIESGPC